MGNMAKVYILILDLRSLSEPAQYKIKESKNLAENWLSQNTVVLTMFKCKRFAYLPFCKEYL